MSESIQIEIPRKVNCMIDLETFGVGERAAVIQAGLCMFDLRAEKEEGVILFSGQINVNLASSLMYGGELDTDTVDWWRAREQSWPSVMSGACTIPHTLDTLDAWYKGSQIEAWVAERTWCHGATFDVPILNSYYRRLRRTPPWNFYDVRDTRTLFELAADMAAWERPRVETAHTAQADAEAQALDVWRAYRALQWAVDREESTLSNNIFFSELDGGGAVNEVSVPPK